MKIIFTNLVSPYAKTGFLNLKPSGFMFAEADHWTMKVISSMGSGSGSGSGNGTIEDAVGSIIGAIKDSDDKDRLLLELEIAMDYFKSSKEISEFFVKIIKELTPKDDWD